MPGGSEKSRALWRGALIGGLKGLFLGLLPAAWTLTPVGAGQPEFKQIALFAPVVTFTLGLLVGLVQANRETK